MEATRVSVPANTGLEDWQFCEDVLPEVSRTFSEPILLLPGPLKKSLTVGYLLCRAVDTVEDCPELSIEEKRELFSRFSAILTGRLPGAPLPLPARTLTLSPGEKKLFGGLPQVLRVLLTIPPRNRAVVEQWVLEMVEGMASYCERQAGQSFWAPEDLRDLERYCYFVAGTVGHMISELFSNWHDQAGEGGSALLGRLRPHAESFGLGLQMVNVIKDVADDFTRGICFLPTDICQGQGFTPELVLEGQHRPGALRAAREVVQRARQHLAHGLSYILELPTDPPGLRLFCLLPLFFALETLKLAEEPEALLAPGRPLKISREAVGQIIQQCFSICQDDRAIVAQYQAAGGHAERPNLALTP